MHLRLGDYTREPGATSEKNIQEKQSPSLKKHIHLANQEEKTDERNLDLLYIFFHFPSQKLDENPIIKIN